mgnify:CR=1 FL=1
MFSRAGEIALKIMIYLATDQQKGRWIGLREIVQEIDSPEAFTAKVLQRLTRQGLIRSLRGPSGGFQLPNRRAVTLHEIIIAIDGEGIFTKCVLGLAECSESCPCPVHDKFKAVRDHLAGVLISTTIEEVKEGLLLGHYYLKV